MNMAKRVFGMAIMGCVVAASAQTEFPLKVDIDVSTKRQTKIIGTGDEGQARWEQVQVIVKVRRASGTVPKEKLFAELYAIGKQIQTGHYGIIDVQKGEFELNKENEFTAFYKSPMYSLGRTTGNVNVGGVYETYLVVISDNAGKIIDTRCGRAIKDEGIAFIRELGPKTLFDRDGNVIGKIKNPGEAFKQAIPAAVSVRDNDD